MSAGAVPSAVLWAVLALAAALTVFAAILRAKNGPRPRPPAELKPGLPLPDFRAVNERGHPVHTRELRGAPAVLLFVRGNWCPFCTRQVEDLTRHYKEIVGLGAKLIFITPKPLETTRRVAEFFDVDFDFWLDESLEIASRFGLVQSAVVPEDYRAEFGEDSVWPTSLVVDPAGTIRYAQLSRFVFDRPKPKKLLKVLRKIKARQ